MLSDHLQVPGTSSEAISRSHWLGKPGADKPRAVLFKFTDNGLKDKVWQAKKHLKSTGSLSEFLRDDMLYSKRHASVTESPGAGRRTASSWLHDGTDQKTCYYL